MVVKFSSVSVRGLSSEQEGRTSVGNVREKIFTSTFIGSSKIILIKVFWALLFEGVLCAWKATTTEYFKFWFEASCVKALLADVIFVVQ